MTTEIISLKTLYPVLEAGTDPTLTAYLPDRINERLLSDRILPGLLIIPGGGYHFVSDREAEPIALKFLAEGFACFVLTYSVEPNRYPTALREVAAALQCIHERAEEWRVDPDSIAILGFSAGGHLAAHYCNVYDRPEVRCAFPESKPVRAAILAYPVISADPKVAHLNSFRNLTGKEAFSEEEICAFSCDRMVTEQTPPTFLWHTAVDRTVPVENSLRYAEALARHDVPFELHVFPAGAHGLATADELTNIEITDDAKRASAWIPMSAAWMKSIFRGE